MSEAAAGRDCLTADRQRGRRLFLTRGAETIEDSSKKERAGHPKKRTFSQGP